MIVITEIKHNTRLPKASPTMQKFLNSFGTLLRTNPKFFGFVQSPHGVDYSSGELALLGLGKENNAQGKLKAESLLDSTISKNAV